MTPEAWVGVDTGGTFTDVVAADGRAIKLPSTPDDPARAVAEGLRRAGGASVLAHGTTVATNALLERRGGRVALVTTEGFADVIEIARQVRPSLYDLWADRPAPLVARDLRLESAGRLAADGTELTPLSVPGVPDGIDAVAVCLLHADRYPDHEQAVARALAARGIDVTCSSEVSPEFREYERTVTTAANAYLRKPCRAYLLGLGELAVDALVMTSAAGLIPVAEAAERPVALLLSGPAGGVVAGSAAAVAAGYPDAVTFDMGGTSTDVCLIRGGRPEPAGQRVVAGLPIRMPSLDVHTIGAGGGSIARLDPGGALVVGPESAGAAPGPACYGRGGDVPTVTDADVMTGRIPVENGLPGLDRLDARAARDAIGRAGVSAEGIIAVVDQAMVQAIRKVTVERGVDPRRLALVAFGGAGPLHACALAEALGMVAVVVPPRAGVLSAAGILASPRQVDLVRSWPDQGEHGGVEAALGALAAEATTQLAREARGLGGVEVEVAVDCRYAGQSHELTVSSVGDFEAEHERRNGYGRPGTAIEVVALRAAARVASPAPLASLPAPAFERRPVTGPAVIAEPDCTVWVPDGWDASVHDSGSWLLTRSES
jgi:N-methylhydantoinase A/oxoprolinase/acetone carboxylase beta subunit